MSSPRWFKSWTPFLVLLFIQGISSDEFALQQTIPVSGPVCPGGKLQYTCTALIELSWEINSSSPVTFNVNTEVNSTITINNVSLVLTMKTMTDDGIKITTTATFDKVTSSLDGQQIVCYSGHQISSHYIQVADRPADCSPASTMPECHVTTNAMGDTDFSITLLPANNLTCVEGYQIQFNGESRNVSLSSPSANFTISDGEGQSVENEIVVYTLDYENRMGLVPCTFSILALNGVKDILNPECMRTSQSVDLTFHWEMVFEQVSLGIHLEVHSKRV